MSQDRGRLVQRALNSAHRLAHEGRTGHGRVNLAQSVAGSTTGAWLAPCDGMPARTKPRLSAAVTRCSSPHRDGAHRELGHRHDDSLRNARRGATPGRRSSSNDRKLAVRQSRPEPAGCKLRESAQLAASLRVPAPALIPGTCSLRTFQNGNGSASARGASSTVVGMEDADRSIATPARSPLFSPVPGPDTTPLNAGPWLWRGSSGLLDRAAADILAAVQGPASGSLLRS